MSITFSFRYNSRSLDGFEVLLVDECTLALENVKGLGGQGR